MQRCAPFGTLLFCLSLSADGGCARIKVGASAAPTDAGNPSSIDSGLDVVQPPVFADAGVDAIPAAIGNHVVVQGSLPDGIEGVFAGATGGGAAQGPVLVYPAPETMFPPNLAKILFQWTATAGNVFQLHFVTGRATLDVYTDGADATCAKAGTGGRCWESARDTLMPYLEAAAGGGIDLQITALDTAAPTKAWQSTMASFHVAPHRVGGAIYYWSTTAQGIRKGTLDGADVADYLTPAGAKNQCVACHTLSRSGKRLSVALPGDLLGLADVGAPQPPFTFGPSSQGFPGENISASWATFSPDESKIVVAGQGVLSLRDATTAAAIGPPIGLPAGMTGSMPDWAPDGRHLAFAASMNAPTARLARHLQGSSIAWLSVDGPNFQRSRNHRAVEGRRQRRLRGPGELRQPDVQPRRQLARLLAR